MAKQKGMKARKEPIASAECKTEAVRPLAKNVAGVATIFAVVVAAVAFVYANLALGPNTEVKPAASATVDWSNADLVSQQNRVKKARSRLQAKESSAALTNLSRALKALHKLPSYQRVGALSVSRHEYATDRVLGDAPTITGYQQGMLLHGESVQFVDAPSMQLLSHHVGEGWAAYNPSIVPVQWAGHSSLLVVYRLSTWHLCTWEGRGSPVQRLPVVDGKKRVTSKVAAAVLYPDFRVALPLHDLAGLDHEAHYCNHHTGMVRMGVDDGRLFTMGGEPWLVAAVVAPEGKTSFCFHNLILCQLQLPSSKSGQVRCKRKIPVRFDRADRISESARADGRLPNVHQKNWVPFVYSDELYLVFTIEPLTVIRVDPETGKCSQVSEVVTPAMSVFHRADSPDHHSTMGVHGGSPLIALPASHGGEFLGIGRIARGNLQYTLFFYTLASSTRAGGGRERQRQRHQVEPDDEGSSSADFIVSRVSPLFCFASTAPRHRGLCETIQFAGGLVIDDASLVVPYGTNDCEAKLAFLQLSSVLAMLRPASVLPHAA